jgi:hypothetical protein
MSKTRVSVTCAVVVLLAPLAVIFEGCQSTSKTPGVSTLLKQRAECMYDVLKTMPGVSEPKIGYDTRGMDPPIPGIPRGGNK